MRDARKQSADLRRRLRKLQGESSDKKPPRKRYRHSVAADGEAQIALTDALQGNASLDLTPLNGSKSRKLPDHIALADHLDETLADVRDVLRSQREGCKGL